MPQDIERFAFADSNDPQKLKAQLSELRDFIAPLVATVKRDKARLDWLDVNCDWPPKRGVARHDIRDYTEALDDIRDYADKGIAADKTKAEEASLETMKRVKA